VNGVLETPLEGTGFSRVKWNLKDPNWWGGGGTPSNEGGLCLLGENGEENYRGGW